MAAVCLVTSIRCALAALGRGVGNPSIGRERDHCMRVCCTHTRGPGSPHRTRWALVLGLHLSRAAATQGQLFDIYGDGRQLHWGHERKPAPGNKNHHCGQKSGVRGQGQPEGEKSPAHASRKMDQRRRWIIHAVRLARLKAVPLERLSRSAVGPTRW